MKKYFLTIDKLVLQLQTTGTDLLNRSYIATQYEYKGNAYIINSNFFLRESQRLEKYYLHSFAVWVDGRHVANLATDCRQFGMANSIKLDFLNEIFYTRPGWLHYLNIITETLPLAFKSLSQLEIAYDFQGEELLRPQLWDIIKDSSFVADNLNPLYKPLDSKLTCSPQQFKAYTFGQTCQAKGGNGKQIVIYNKTEEIIAKKYKKQYILDYYAANGFDMSRPVERIEAKLTGKYFKATPIYLNKLNTVSHLGQIFRLAVGNTFIFREVTKSFYDANRNKKTPTVTLIEFPEFSNEPLYTVSQGETVKENNDRCNSIELKNTVLRYIQKGNEQDLHQIHYVMLNVKPPKEKMWPTLIKRYAQAYQGSLDDVRIARIEQFC